MSDDNPRRAKDEASSGQHGSNPTDPPEPLIVTIEPQIKGPYSQESKSYRLDCARYRLEQKNYKLDKKSYDVAHRTMTYLLIYTGFTCAIAISSIIATCSAEKSAKAAIDQIEAMKRSERAILDIDFKWDKDTQIMSYTLTNIGHTTALKITTQIYGGIGPPTGETFPTWNCPPIEYTKANIREIVPSVGGFNLREGESRTISQITTVPDDAKTGKLFERQTINVGFEDVFGKVGQAYAALSYDSRIPHQNFKRCYLQTQE